MSILSLKLIGQFQHDLINKLEEKNPKPCLLQTSERNLIINVFKYETCLKNEFYSSLEQKQQP